MAAPQLITTSAGLRKYEVYIATTPLRAAKGPAQVLLSAGFSAGLWDLQHFMVIIKPSSPPPSQAVVFDFQPEDPENIYVALSALSAQSIPGVILERKMSKIPRKRCWFVGSSAVDAIEEARNFNSTWETDLRIGQHDCRDYVNGLAELLTGEKRVLEQLKHRPSS